jgi:hypothetical protein
VSAVRSAPSTPGVYVFRIFGARLVCRLKGKSDIVYIGTTVAIPGSLRRRLAQHLAPRHDQTGLAPRIRRAQQEVGRLEIAWVTCPDNYETRLLESELLDMYCADHIELPPLNRIESGIQIRGLMRLISLLPDHVRREALAKIRRAPVGRD